MRHDFFEFARSEIREVRGSDETKDRIEFPI